MNNRRNKLLLSLAKKQKQSDVFKSEDLSILIDKTNIEDATEGMFIYLLKFHVIVPSLY